MTPTAATQGAVPEATSAKPPTETDMSQPKKDDAKPTLFGFDMLARLLFLAVRDEVGFIDSFLDFYLRVVATQSQSA